MTTYSELRQAIIEDSHRPDLSNLVPRFIREAEGMLRRELSAYLLTASFDDTSRVSANQGVYNLPVRTVDIRRITQQKPDSLANQPLDRVSVDSIRTTATVAPPLVYAQYGEGTIEIRGVPAEDTVFDILYFGTPAPLVNDADTNELLTDHQSLYQQAALFFLYLHTQDLELSQAALDIYNGILTTLNEQMARQIGGQQIAQAYNFTHRSSY